MLIIVGDLLERMTGGLFPATRHRVQIPAARDGNSLAVAIVKSCVNKQELAPDWLHKS